MKTRLLLPSVGLALLPLLAGCGGDDAPTSQPGATQSAHNAQDVMFAQQMVPHHEQAIVMADLALARSVPAELSALAKRIKAAQGPEIAQLNGWLREWGEVSMGGHDMHGMAGGMLSDDELTALEAAQGAEFARLFYRGMIAHHEGAVAMAQDQLAKGSDPRVKALAQAVVTGQTAEIAEMKARLGKM